MMHKFTSVAPIAASNEFVVYFLIEDRFKRETIYENPDDHTPMLDKSRPTPLVDDPPHL